MMLDPTLTAQLDRMAVKVVELAKSAGLQTMPRTATSHSVLDRQAAFRQARSYAVSIGKLTEAIEMGDYRRAESRSLRADDDHSPEAHNRTITQED